MNENKPLPAAARYNAPCESTLYFFPSQVSLGSMFLNTFGRSEVENTAAVIVKVLAANGDVFRSATRQELAAGFNELTKNEGPWRRWFNNPFMRLDIHDLVARGFAVWDGDTAIRFTPEGLDRMRRWILQGPLASGTPQANPEISESRIQEGKQDA